MWYVHQVRALRGLGEHCLFVVLGRSYNLTGPETSLLKNKAGELGLCLIMILRTYITRGAEYGGMFL